MTDDTGWPDLIEGFVALGGIAENVRLGIGDRGRGLFPGDASLPARLRVPETLLLPLADVVFVNERLCVAPSSKMGAAEKNWFEYYANEYTWGAGSRAETENFLAECLALPDHIRQTLTKSFGMTFFSPNHSASFVQQRFLDSRGINYKGNRVVMPMVELVNHDGSFPGYEDANGIAVSGKFDSEMLVNYGARDPFEIFQSWGFVSEVEMAMSLPLMVRTNLGEIRVKRDFENHRVEMPGGTGKKLLLPIGSADKSGIEFSFLPLGAKRAPRMPKGIFHRVLRETGRQVADEPFELIQFLNRQRFLDLLKDLEAVEGNMARALRTMCRLQLDALSHCYGTRTI